MKKRDKLYSLPIGRLFRSPSRFSLAILLVAACSEPQAPAPVAVTPPEVGVPVPAPSSPSIPLPRVSGDYVLKLVDNQTLPVMSPYGAGAWDYDDDVGTWKLTEATFLLKADGTYINSVAHHARSGATSSQTFVGSYTTVSPTAFQIGPSGSASTLTISGSTLVWKWTNGIVLTFER